jgi:hypothetical protein
VLEKTETSTTGNDKTPVTTYWMVVTRQTRLTTIRVVRRREQVPVPRLEKIDVAYKRSMRRDMAYKELL